jgi:transposase-like protein
MGHQHDAAVSLITDPLQHCPRCGSDRLEPVVEQGVDEVHFLCRECGRCWDVWFGTVTRVPPATCLGCSERGRCLEIYALDHPELDDAGE